MLVLWGHWGWPARGVVLQEREEQSKADQVGVEPPQKVVKAREALQEATPHPMGNWSSATSGGFA